MLKVTGLTAGYGDIVAVRELSFTVEKGEIMGLLGPNGAGKTSTLMALAGLVTLEAGTIEIDGVDITALPVEKRIGHGMALVPEGRRVFPDLSVRENLMVGGHSTSRQVLDEGIAHTFSMFPRLEERAEQLAGSLSGGEQQMLAIGRALVSRPAIVLVDELSLGLMPKVVDECYVVLQAMRAEGIAIVLVEQNTSRALEVSDTLCILEAGNVSWRGTAAAARADPALVETLLGQG